MKILLFGEFSGLFNNLKEGLVAEGHDVFLASDGDGTKDYPSDFRYDAKFRIPSKIKYYFEVINILLNRRKLRGYDAVLIVSPVLFGNNIFLKNLVFNYLIRNNKKCFLSGTGLTPASLTFWYKSGQKYHYYAEGLMVNPYFQKNYYNNKKMIDWEMKLHDRISGYIPIWYEYAEPFRKHPKTLDTIRIPINVNEFEYKPNIVKDKIVFFHGRSLRPYAKGTNHIEEAFNRLKKDYGNIADFVIAGGLPFNEYIDLVSRTNVILDDTNSYSIAMNGLFSLAKGKIVMGGAEKEGNDELGVSNNPVINLTPDVNQICESIIKLIQNKDKFEEYGRQGRSFVEKYHNYREIAKQYVQVFSDN